MRHFALRMRTRGSVLGLAVRYLGLFGVGIVCSMAATAAAPSPPRDGSPTPLTSGPCSVGYETQFASDIAKGRSRSGAAIKTVDLSAAAEAAPTADTVWPQSTCGCLRFFVLGELFTGAKSILHWVNAHPDVFAPAVVEKFDVSWTSMATQHSHNVFAVPRCQHGRRECGPAYAAVGTPTQTGHSKWFQNQIKQVTGICKDALLRGQPRSAKVKEPVAGDAFNLMANGMAQARRTVEGIRQECGPDIRFVVMLKEPIEQINWQRALNRGFTHAPAALLPACEDATVALAHARGGSVPLWRRSFSQTLQAELQLQVANVSNTTEFPAGGCAQEYAEPNLHVQQLQLLMEHFPARNIMVVFSTQFEYHPLAVISQVQRFLGAPRPSADDKSHKTLQDIIENNVTKHGPYIAVESPWLDHHVRNPTTDDANVALCRYFRPQHEALRKLLGLKATPFHACSSTSNISASVCQTRVPPQTEPLVHKKRSLLQTNHVILAELYHRRFPSMTFPKPTKCMVDHGLSVGRGILPRPFEPRYTPSKDTILAWNALRYVHSCCSAPRGCAARSDATPAALLRFHVACIFPFDLWPGHQPARTTNHTLIYWCLVPLGCLHCIRSPVFFHYPHGSGVGKEKQMGMKDRFLIRLQAELKERQARGPVVMGQDIEFIVVSNNKTGIRRSLLDMYDALGVPYTHIVVPACLVHWSWKCKVTALHKHFMEYERMPEERRAQRPRYFAVTDLGDVLLNHLPVDQDILDGKCVQSACSRSRPVFIKVGSTWTMVWYGGMVWYPGLMLACDQALTICGMGARVRVW